MLGVDACECLCGSAQTALNGAINVPDLYQQRCARAQALHALEPKITPTGGSAARHTRAWPQRQLGAGSRLQRYAYAYAYAHAHAHARNRTWPQPRYSAGSR